jgi:pyruvate formate lyase activating enzyme
MVTTGSLAWSHLRGLVRMSLCDWPGHPSLVLFFGGCNLRCPTCHNAGIAWHPEQHPGLFPPDVARLLARRSGWLDGVVISGGEPTMVPDLPGFLREIAAAGLPVKLDSNGMRPDVLAEILEDGLIQAASVDVKGPFEMYPELTGGQVSAAEARDNLKRIFDLARRLPDTIRFRLTRVPGLCDDDIRTAAGYLPAGCELTVQPFVPPGRNHAQAHQEARQLPGDLVAGAHRPGHTESPQGQRHQGSAPGQAAGQEGRDQAR